jgi:serine/threonine protein kinase
VLKEQQCQVGTRFDEHSILTAVHSPENVPGVVEAVYHKLIETPRDFCPLRKKHRLGLWQMGKPLTSIPTVAQMLRIVFDILEGILSPIIHILYAHSFAVLRYLRFERQVLHRDISKGNILFVEDNLSSQTGARSGGADEADEMVGPKGLPLCFIGYLLRERCAEMLHNWAYTNVTPNQYRSPKDLGVTH